MKELTNLLYGREPFSDWVKKSIITIISAIGIGFSVSFMVVGNIGTDPVTLFSTGIGGLLNSTVGVGMTTLNSVLIVFLLIFGRKYIYAATILNTIFMGMSVDMSYSLVASLRTDDSFITGLIFCIIGLVFLGFFIGLYISLNFGGGAVDGFEYYLSVLINKPFNVAQLIFYGVSFVFGLLVGLLLDDISGVGIGTVIGLFIPALTSGPTIKFFNKRWSNILKFKKPIDVVK